MAQGESRLENIRNLRISNLDAAFATAFITLMSGTILVGLVRYLGGGDVWINATAAIPSLMGVLQIPGSVIGQRFASYKRFVLPGGLIWRFGYVPMLLILFLPWGGEAKLWTLAISLAVAWAAIQLVSPIYNDWLAAMVPADSRGWFFSRRNGIAAGVGAVAGMVGGVVLDAFRRSDEESLGYATIFGLGLVCAAISMALYMQMSDRVRETTVRRPVRSSLAEMARPLRDRHFRVVLVFFVVFIAGQALAGNLFAAFALETLRMDFTVLQATGISSAIGQLATIRMWGFLSDKYGNKPILAILSAGLTLTPTIWLACGPGHDLSNALVLILGHVFVGIVWSGIGVCQFNLLLATSPEPHRAGYLGVGMAIQALVGAGAPMAGSILMTSLRGHLDAEAAYKTVFLATMLLRLISVALLIRVREPGSAAIGSTFQHLRKVSPRGYAAMRTLIHGTDVPERERAMAQVASDQFGMAADEVLKALHDPSPRIRREAASTLARLGDPRAVDELIHQLEEHPDLVEDETVEALAAFDDPRSVPSLVSLLNSPRASLRRAAAKALGRIGGEEAKAPLMEAAGAKGDPDLRRVALQALRMLGASDAEPQVVQAIYDPMPSVRIAAAEAVAELHITNAADALRQALHQFDDESESELAYALGCVGTVEDLPLILEHAKRCVSVITRRRALLGVARLLGVESEAYRLMLSAGMSRDNLLLERVAPLHRRSKRLRAAVERYLAGDEPSALRALATGKAPAEFRAMAECPVEELFLVAASAFVRHNQTA